MGAMSWADYAKDDEDYGTGKIRLAVLLAKIEKGERIDMSTPSGKFVVHVSDEMKDDMNDTVDGKMPFDNAGGKDVTGTFKQKYSGRGKKPLCLINKGVETNVSLTSVEKTKDFGSNQGSGGGSDNTALFEGAAAWIGAIRFGLKSDIDPDHVFTIEEFRKVRSKVSTDESMENIHDFIMNDDPWRVSSILTANALWDSCGKGRNPQYQWFRGMGVVDVIEDHFKWVNKNHIVTDAEGNEKKFRPFSNINKWTPADIWLCDCDVSWPLIKKEKTFAGLNEFLRELVLEKKLVGVSLKKVESSKAKLAGVNFGEKKKRDRFKAAYSNSVKALDVYVLGTQVKTQFRATDKIGKTWQGEVTGGEVGAGAKHGKVGGGVMSQILESVLEEGLYSGSYGSAAAVSTLAQGNGLDVQLQTLADKYKNNINGNIARSKGGASIRATGSTDDILDTTHGRKAQWRFSKFLGLRLIDMFYRGGTSVKQRNEIASRIYWYATSQSSESAPFIKVSS